MSYGTQVITTQGVIGKSGDPVLVRSVEITSNGTAGSLVSLKNGTTSGGTIYWQGSGTVSKTVTPNNFPSNGIYLPGGCYVDWDINGTRANIMYEQYHSV